MKNCILIIAILLIAFFCAGTVANATPENREIIFSCSPDGWPPFFIVGDDGTVAGIMVDALQAIASAHGYEVNIRTIPEKREALMLDRGIIDARAKAKEWVKVDPEQYTWTAPVIMISVVVFFPKESTKNFSTPEDLVGLRLGTGLGYTYQYLNPYFADNRIRRADAQSGLSILKMLIIGRTDAAIMDKPVALWLIKQNPEFQGRLKFSKPFQEVGYRLMFTKKYNWKPFAELFNQELEKMRGDGGLEKIMKKYQ